MLWSLKDRWIILIFLVYREHLVLEFNLYPVCDIFLARILKNAAVATSHLGVLFLCKQVISKNKDKQKMKVEAQVAWFSSDGIETYLEYLADGIIR